MMLSGHEVKFDAGRGLSDDDVPYTSQLSFHKAGVASEYRFSVSLAEGRQLGLLSENLTRYFLLPPVMYCNYSATDLLP